jgi:hypothetical protein
MALDQAPTSTFHELIRDTPHARQTPNKKQPPAGAMAPRRLIFGNSDASSDTSGSYSDDSFDEQVLSFFPF